MTDEEFEALVERGINELRPEIRSLMKNVAIVIADEPTDEQVRSADDEPDGALFGLYEGVPLPERGIETPLLPDKITIFKNPILSAYHTPLEVALCVSNTVWHEVAHHFGYDEEWIAKEEEFRNKTL